MSFQTNSLFNILDSSISPTIKSVLSNCNTLVGSESNNINEITLKHLLGKGGYGSVYLASNEKQENFAVKCIENNKYGISSLVEIAIMSVMHHPYLARAIKINTTSDKIYIIQNLALSDLKVYRGEHDIPINKCINWAHMIIQGLNCLHYHNIIHGDIKASNILVFNDDTVKITDFTLSTNFKWTNNYTPCTSTHRPPEVWLKHKWTEKIDIWALGCTIFEMVYGKSLFVSQNKKKSINALLDWNNFVLKESEIKDSSDLEMEYYETEYITFSLPKLFNGKDPINQLILWLLNIDPNQRPSTKKLLKHDLFSHLKIIPTMMVSNNVILLSLKTETMVKQKLSNILDNKIAINIGYNIYSRLTEMMKDKNDLKI